MTVQTIPLLQYAIVDSLNESIKSQYYNYYYFIGLKPELSNDETVNSESFKRKIRDGIIFLRKIMPNDTTLIIDNIRWIENRVYDSWDDKLDMSSLLYYCINLKDEVFKCLDNGNGLQSTVSPVKPDFNWSEPFKTSDGYTWQYMFTLDQYLKSRFLSSTHIPVRNALSKSFFSGQSLKEVNVLSGGQGYITGQKTRIDIVTNHKSIHVTQVNSSGGITQLNSGELGLIQNIQNIDGIIININSQTGSGASFSITESIDGKIQDIVINEPGTNYRVGDSLTIYKPANVIASIDTNGSFSKIDIIDSGIGYTETPNINISYTDESASRGIGKYYIDGVRNQSAIFEVIIDQNPLSSTFSQIQDIIIRDPGVNYDNQQTTRIVVTGDGYGAEVTPIVVDGQIVSASVTNPGKNYTWMKLKPYYENAIEEAILEPVLIESDIRSNQAVIEQLRLKPEKLGGIYSIKVLNGGTKYTSSCTLTLTGDGTGAKAIPIIDNGVIKRIVVTDYGYGYNYCNITITDTPRNSLTNKVDAVLRVVISPSMGHGTNTAIELNSNSLILHSLIQDIQDLEYLLKDYTHYGIIRGLKNINNETISTVLTDYVVYVLQFTSITGLNINDELYYTTSGRTYKFKVVKIENDNNLVSIIALSPFVSLPNSGTIRKTQNMYQYPYTSIINSPVVNKYSGELLYASIVDDFTIDSKLRVSIKSRISMVKQ
jgi:hypothetical protein